MEDEILLDIITEDDKKIYMLLIFSDNPPADSKNPGCIGIYLYDSHMMDIDGGELDFEKEDTTLESMIDICLEFMDIKYKSYTKTASLKFF